MSKKYKVMAQGPYGPPQAIWMTLDEWWQIYSSSQLRDQGAAPMKPPPVLGTESEEASS